MEWNYLTLVASIVVLGGAGFIYVLIESRAYDRKWGKRHHPGE